MKVDDCNSGANPSALPFNISTTITTHHFHIITAKLSIFIRIKYHKTMRL